MIDKIIAVLKKHEQRLSDGFYYYLPLWTPEHGDIEKDEFLHIIAAEILEAVKAEMEKAGRNDTRRCSNSMPRLRHGEGESMVSDRERLRSRLALRM